MAAQHLRCYLLEPNLIKFDFFELSRGVLNSWPSESRFGTKEMGAKLFVSAVGVPPK